MAFYHDVITEKSFLELAKLKRKLNFVLIGGWAVWLYTHKLKSKDIDIIVDFGDLSVLQGMYQVVKNVRLNKYEARIQEVQVDIYLPYYSNIGIPVEDLINKTFQKEGYTVLSPDYLFALKLYTLQCRGRKPKGRKDLIDIVSLITSNVVNFAKVKEILKKHKLEATVSCFHEFLKETFEMKEMGLNIHAFAREKKRIADIPVLL